jgi:acyl carrier protein
MMTLTKKIIKVIEEVATWKEGEKIYPSSDLYDDLMFDELDIVELLIALEEVFNIIIEDDDAFQWKTVKDIISYVADEKEEE